MDGPKVGDIVESLGGHFIGEVVRMWKDGCIIDFQDPDDNDDGSPSFGEDYVRFNEVRIVTDPALAAYLKAERGKEKKIQELWGCWSEERDKIWEIRYNALQQSSNKETLAGLDEVIKLLLALHEEDSQGG